MFFVDGNDEQMYIPRCCKDKYFGILLPEELERTQTTTIYANSDFELAAILFQLVRSRPLCPVTLVLPEAIEAKTTYVLHTWLMHKYSFDVRTHAMEPHITTLHLVTPEGEEVSGLLRNDQAYVPYKKDDARKARVMISKARFNQMIAIIGGRIAIFGNAVQEPSTETEVPNIITVTRNPRIISELETMVRTRTNNSHTFQFFEP